MPPPPEPEVQAAADAVAAKMPVEIALDRSVSVTGVMASQVAERLIGNGIAPPGQCRREVFADYLMLRIATRVTATLPTVAAKLRARLAERLAYRTSAADLAAEDRILDTPPGQALILATWGSELPQSDAVIDLFAGALLTEAPGFARQAQADCRAAHGRPPPRLA
jgi:hypothetical protein